LIVLRKIIVSEDIGNLRKVEDAGRITVIYYRLQTIYIEKDFLLNKRNSYKDRYHFERDNETIKKMIYEKDKDTTTLVLLLRENECKRQRKI